MSTFAVANHWIDVAVSRAGSVKAANRESLKKRIQDHYLATITLAARGESSASDFEEACRGLASGVGPIVDRRLRAKCARKVHSRRIGDEVAKVAANSIKPPKGRGSSITELVHMTGEQIKDTKHAMITLRNQVEEGVDLRSGALIYFRKTDTPMDRTLLEALEADGVSENEFYQSIAV